MDSKPQNIYKVENPKKKTIYDYMEEYLFEKYQIRYNEISQDFQISLKNSNNWEELEVNSVLIELAKCNIEVPPNKLEIFLRSYVVPHFNPISKYFEDLEDWDGQDYISKLCSYVPVQDSDSFSYHLKNGWLELFDVPSRKVILISNVWCWSITNRIQANQPGVGLYALLLSQNI